MGRINRQLIGLQLSAIRRSTGDPSDGPGTAEQPESRKRGREDESEPVQKPAPYVTILVTC
jgi:hypothetical protein